MTEPRLPRVLVLSPRHLTGYRDMVHADSRSLGENPVALLQIPDDRIYATACSKWLEVSDRLVIYGDFGEEDVVDDLVREARDLSIEIDWRTLGNVPKPSWRERLIGALS